MINENKLKTGDKVVCIKPYPKEKIITVGKIYKVYNENVRPYIIDDDDYHHYFTNSWNKFFGDLRELKLNRIQTK